MTEQGPQGRPIDSWSGRGKEWQESQQYVEVMARLTADYTHTLFSKPELSDQLSTTEATVMLLIPSDNQEVASLNRQIGMQAEQQGEKVTYITASKSNTKSNRYDSFSITHVGAQGGNVQEQGAFRTNSS